MTGDAAIRTENLTRDFGEVRALDGLDLEVPEGGVYGFLGPNGAGKTTTIRLLLGLIEPTAGGAEVLGHPVASEGDAVRARVGVLLEHSGLYDRLTAMENLRFFGGVARLSRPEIEARAKDLLGAMDLWERRDARADEMSKGMRRKLALARALLARPPLLFLDEPTAGLDAPSAIALRESLGELTREAGVTVFLTTHNLLEAEKVCDRVAVVRAGRLLVEGTPEEIGRGGGPPALEVEVDGAGDEALAALRELAGVSAVRREPPGLVVEGDGTLDRAEVIRALVQAGARVEGARERRQGLEESFLRVLREGDGEDPRGGGDAA